MARSSKRVHRSAGTGRFVKRATAARHPNRTVSEGNGAKNRGGGTAHRNATTGPYVTAATVTRNPAGTVTENG